MPTPGSFGGVSSRLWEGLPILSPFLRSSSPAEPPSEVPTTDAETLPATGVVIFTLSPTQASLNHMADWYKAAFKNVLHWNFWCLERTSSPPTVN